MPSRERVLVKMTPIRVLANKLFIPVGAPLLVSLTIGILMWYTNAVRASAHDDEQDRLLLTLRDDLNNHRAQLVDMEKEHTRKLDQILTDVGFIRGQLSQFPIPSRK